MTARGHRAAVVPAAADWAVLTPAAEAPPLHQQVTAAITRRIAEGPLRPGSLLPPEIALARQFGVSRHTIRAGIAALVREGLLERRPGKGTFVRIPRIEQSLACFYSLAHEMRARGSQLETSVLARGQLAPGDPLAAPATAALGLPDPAEIGYLRRLRLVDGTPLALETITFPAALCPALLANPAPGAPDLGAEPFYDVLAARAGVAVARARETLRPEAISGREACALRVAPGTPVFRVERASYTRAAEGERAVEWRTAAIRGDRYEYMVDLLNPREAGDGG